ncbi:MAG: ATP-binding cassette domain-containing protein [Phycisphaerae bacterium]|nr:ATP-binding cassette domain-containing protein [Phycisphaerae bacterium]
MIDVPIFSAESCSVITGDKTILAPISFSIGVGDFVAITGPSGSGKSTLLQLLLGFMPTSTGQLLFKGQELTISLLSELRSQTAVVFQEPVLDGQNVYDALIQPFSYKHNHLAKPQAAQLKAEMQAVGLDDIELNQTVTTLSGGEKQRLALVRALLLSRPILILDEISSALDSVNRDRIHKLLAQRKHTVIAVSHDPVWLQRSSSILELQAFKKELNHVGYC